MSFKSLLKVVGGAIAEDLVDDLVRDVIPVPTNPNRGLHGLIQDGVTQRVAEDLRAGHQNPELAPHDELTARFAKRVENLLRNELRGRRWKPEGLEGFARALIGEQLRALGGDPGKLEALLAAAEAGPGERQRWFRAALTPALERQIQRLSA